MCQNQAACLARQFIGDHLFKKGFCPRAFYPAFGKSRHIQQAAIFRDVLDLCPDMVKPV